MNRSALKSTPCVAFYAVVSFLQAQALFHLFVLLAFAFRVALGTSLTTRNEDSLRRCKPLRTRLTQRQCSVSSRAQTATVNMEKADYPQHVEVMEKAGYPQPLEAGLCAVPDGSDAPMVVSELPQPVHAGSLPARTGSARRVGQICPLGSEALEHAPKKDDSDGETGDRSVGREPKTFVMKRRTLWIGLVVLLVIIAAVVGGAVGGTRRSKKSSSEAELVNSTSSTRFVTSPINPWILKLFNTPIAHRLKTPMLPPPALQRQHHHLRPRPTWTSKCKSGNART